jgi:DNA-binding NarL/FixJ family response regulator
MAQSAKTHIFCLDDHRSFSEDVKKRFADTSRYSVINFHNADDLIKNMAVEKEHNFCKVAIMGLHDSKENSEVIEHLIIEIKKIDSSTGIIVLAPPEKIDEVKKSIRFNVDSYISRNGNTVLRIHNTVKKLISEHSLLIFRKKRNISLLVLISFLILSVLFAVVAYFELPRFF